MSLLDLKGIGTMFEIKPYLEDISANQPLNINTFPKTNTITKCDRCNYKELCEMY